MNLERLTDFITFAETPSPKRHWLQSAWGWAQDQIGIALTGSFLDLSLRQLSTDVRNGVCESAFCAAGHGAFMSGHRLVYNETRVRNGSTGQILGLTATWCIPERQKIEDGTGLPVFHAGLPVWEDVPGEPMVFIHQVGADYYDLTEVEAKAFFLPGNDLDDMKALINGFCYSRDVDMPYLDHPAADAEQHNRDNGDEYDEDEYDEDEYDEEEGVRATQVLDMQADLLTRLTTSRTFQRYIEGCLTSDHVSTRAAVRRDPSLADAVFRNAVVMSTAHTKHVEMAEAYNVTPDMTDLLTHAATTLDASDEFHVGLAPAPVGIVRFDKPLLCRDIRSMTLKAHWLVWGPAQALDPESDNPMEPITVTMLNWYNDGDDPDAAGYDFFDPDDFDRARHYLGRWLWIGSEYIADGCPIGTDMTPVSEWNQAEVAADGDEPAEFQTNLPRLAYALWLLLGQTITSTEVEYPDRATRRRHKTRPLPPRVTVIKLRRRSTRETSEPGLVEWQHQWIVRGHPRWQPYGTHRKDGHDHEFGPVVAPQPGELSRFCTTEGCDGRLTRIWVNPFLKGPEGAPLKQSQKVYQLER